MQSWWNDWNEGKSPYANAGVYIGGCSVSCLPPPTTGISTGIDKCVPQQDSCVPDSKTNPRYCIFQGCKTATGAPCQRQYNLYMTQSELALELGQGSSQDWGLIPIWVGIQAPEICQNPLDTAGDKLWGLGDDPSEGGSTTAAYKQKGIDEANAATSRAGSLQLGGIIYYDMEYYREISLPDGTPCKNPVITFLSSWVAQVQKNGYKAGIYIGGGNLADAAQLNPQPDSIWVASWNYRNYYEGWPSANWPPKTPTPESWIVQYCSDGSKPQDGVPVICPDAIPQTLDGTDPYLLGFQVDEDNVNGLVDKLDNTETTLTVSLSASVSSGGAPLTTKLTAAVGGTETGTINYTFWWNCLYSGTSISQALASCGAETANCQSNSTGLKCNNQSAASYAASHTYLSSGTQIAKVIVERGSAPAVQAQTTIQVTSGAAPAITGVSPTSYPASNNSQTMLINGSNFKSGDTLTFVPPEGGTIASTASKLTFVSAAQLSYQFNDQSDSGNWSVKVNSPDGTQHSNAASFTVTAAAPAITGVSPTSYPASNNSQTMLINGSNFQNGATVTFHDPQGNSYVRTPTFLSAGQLSHQFNDGNDAGTWTVFATNPDGQTSNTLSFTVTSSAPSVSGVSPTSYSVSNYSQSMTINGSNFQNGASVTFYDPQGNPYVRTPAFISSSQLSYQFNDGSDAGTWTVFVTNPGGVTSNTVSFTVK